jgi:hypothetical protein
VSFFGRFSQRERRLRDELRAAADPETPPEFLVSLMLRSGDPEAVVIASVENPAVSIRDLFAALDAGWGPEQESVAATATSLLLEREDADEELLEELVRSFGLTVRVGIAGSKHLESLSPAAFAVLARDRSKRVRAKCASSSNPEHSQIVCSLVNDRDTLVRESLASNSAGSHACLEQLLADESVAVRTAAAGNPVLVAADYEAALNDRDPGVRRVVVAAHCASFSDELFARACRDRSGRVRAACALSTRPSHQAILAEFGLDVSHGALSAGDRVAFTGYMRDREELEAMATACGLVITSSISVTTAILVTDAEPVRSDVATRKLRDALDYGTRIATSSDFRRELAHVDSGDGTGAQPHPR